MISGDYDYFKNMYRILFERSFSGKMPTIAARFLSCPRFRMTRRGSP